MNTQKELIERYGNPMVKAQRVKFEPKHMVVWDIPDDINKAIRILPNRIFCNRAIVGPLEKVFRALIKTEDAKGNPLSDELRTYDGCYNPRFMRGSTTKISRHAWGLAIDFNAAWNPLGGKVTFSKEYLKVWRDLGWVCGADWKARPDGMHKEYPV